VRFLSQYDPELCQCSEKTQKKFDPKRKLLKRIAQNRVNCSKNKV